MKSREDLYNFLLTKRPAELPLTKHDIELIQSALEIMEQVAAQQESVDQFKEDWNERNQVELGNNEKLYLALPAQFLYELDTINMLVSRQAMKLLKLAGIDLGIDFDKPFIY